MRNKLSTYWDKYWATIIALIAMPIVGFLVGTLLYKW